MPTYQYYCTSCNALEEVFHKITDAPLQQCSHCNELALVRKPSKNVGLSFQGSGFYQTDYCSKQGGDSCCPCSKSKE